MQLNDLSPPTQAWYRSGRVYGAAGHQVFVRDAGRGPTILLIHGYPTSCYDWRGVMSALDDRFRVVAFDLPGFGLSDKPVAYSYSLFQQADVVEALASALGIGDAHVVSHDLGTSVHTELLARELEGRLTFRLRGSTFLNGSMLQAMAHITPFQQLLASNSTLPDAMAMCEQIAGVYVPSLQALMRRPEAVTDEDALVMNELMLYRDGHRRLAATAGYMRERYLHADRWLGALERTKVPLQFVWADGDPIAHVEMGREHARRCPQAKYVELSGLGHFLLIEDPHRVAAEIAGAASQARSADDTHSTGRGSC